MSAVDGCVLDELDIAILKHLTPNGRKRFTEIAEDLNVSHGTVRNRYQRMQEISSLKIATWLDPKRVGFHAGAQVKFSIDTPYLEEATVRVATFPEVTWLGQTMGEFNLMADVFCQDIQHLNRFLSHDLRAVPRIRHTEVGLYTRLHKVTTLPSLELLECAPGRGVPDKGDAGTGSSLISEDLQLPNYFSRDGSAKSAPKDSALDQLDIAILEHLSEDGRRPFTEIAEALGVSHGTVRNRYNRMLELNVVKVMCWLEPQEVGFHAAAHLDLSIEIPHLEQAAATIATFPEVSWLAQVIGEFNLMADVFCVDLDCLDNLVSDRLKGVAGLRHMEVALYSRIEKITTMPNLQLLRRAVSGR